MAVDLDEKRETGHWLTPSLALYEGARGLVLLATGMQTVGIGWQVYEKTGKASALAMSGLVQFLPLLLLFPVTGYVADRFPKKWIMFLCNVGLGVGALTLALTSRFGSVNWIYFVLTLTGICRAFSAPAGSAFVTELVGDKSFVRAMPLHQMMWEGSQILGPTLGGIGYAAMGGPSLFSCSAVLIFFGVIATGLVQTPRRARSGPPQRTMDTLLAGIAYVRREKIILGALTLDLFAVFFGGITALLPIFAKDILRVGPAELGYFRSASALGAGAAALLLARFPLTKNAGKVLFYSVAMFGAMTLLFARSNTLWISMCALALMGASDMVSVIVRSTVTQLAVPHEMRGRVGAVNSVFISASNELGEWESGITAHWFGARRAATLGAFVTLGVVALSAIVFRELRSVDRFEDVKPRPLPPEPPHSEQGEPS